MGVNLSSTTKEGTRVLSFIRAPFSLNLIVKLNWGISWSKFCQSLKLGIHNLNAVMIFCVLGILASQNRFHRVMMKYSILIILSLSLFSLWCFKAIPNFKYELRYLYNIDLFYQCMSALHTKRDSRLEEH